jgi:hypothetical protein
VAEGEGFFFGETKFRKRKTADPFNATEQDNRAGRK